MKKWTASSPVVRARLTYQLACGYLHDASHRLARVVAHPHPTDATWRKRLKERTTYWWRAWVHLHRVADRKARGFRGVATRCLAWHLPIPRIGRPPIAPTRISAFRH
jgi:hypothetical protein